MVKNECSFFLPRGACVCAHTHVHKCVGFSFSEAIKSLYEMKRFETDGSLESDKALCIGER